MSHPSSTTLTAYSFGPDPPPWKGTHSTCPHRAFVRVKGNKSCADFTQCPAYSPCSINVSSHYLRASNYSYRHDCKTSTLSRLFLCACKGESKLSQIGDCIQSACLHRCSVSALCGWALRAHGPEQGVLWTTPVERGAGRAGFLAFVRVLLPGQVQLVKPSLTAQADSSVPCCAVPSQATSTKHPPHRWVVELPLCSRVCVDIPPHCRLLGLTLSC